MKPTQDRNEDKEKCLFVSAETLASLLDCGRFTAVKVGQEAGARVQIGRRVLFSMEKVKEYLDRKAIGK